MLEEAVSRHLSGGGRRGSSFASGGVFPSNLKRDMPDQAARTAVFRNPRFFLTVPCSSSAFVSRWAVLLNSQHPAFSFSQLLAVRLGCFHLHSPRPQLAPWWVKGKARLWRPFVFIFNSGSGCHCAGAPSAATPHRHLYYPLFPPLTLSPPPLSGFTSPRRNTSIIPTPLDATERTTTPTYA
jgi:hypothetical protein